MVHASITDQAEGIFGLIGSLGGQHPYSPPLFYYHITLIGLLVTVSALLGHSIV
jgi:hypothetical protein